MIDQPREDKPALTVVIQSWWTPVLALVMLVIGLLDIWSTVIDETER
jgi:hypothetical protein